VAESLERARRFFEDANRRRTTRHFATDPVPRELIEYAIRTAGTAPSGAHQQPWTFVAVSDVPDLAVDEVAARGTVTVTEDGPALIAFVLSAPGVGGAVQSPPFFLTIVALRPFEFARTAFADAVEQGDTDAVNEMLTRRLADAGALDGLSPDDRVALANAVRSCAVVEEIEVMKICTATTTIAGRTGELRFFFLQDGSGHWRILTW
jgi:nitroreductase